MEKRIYPEPIESVVSPEPFGRKSFTDAGEAIAALQALYSRNTKFLRDSFASLAGSRDAVIEAPANKNTGAGLVLLISLQRG